MEGDVQNKHDKGKKVRTSYKKGRAVCEVGRERQPEGESLRERQGQSLLLPAPGRTLALNKSLLTLPRRLHLNVSFALWLFPAVPPCFFWCVEYCGFSGDPLGFSIAFDLRHQGTSLLFSQGKLPQRLSYFTIEDYVKLVEVPGVCTSSLLFFF